MRGWAIQANCSNQIIFLVLFTLLLPPVSWLVLFVRPALSTCFVGLQVMKKLKWEKIEEKGLIKWEEN